MASREQLNYERGWRTRVANRPLLHYEKLCDRKIFSITIDYRPEMNPRFALLLILTIAGCGGKTTEEPARIDTADSVATTPAPADSAHSVTPTPVAAGTQV